MNIEEMLNQAKQKEDENSWNDALAIYEKLSSKAEDVNCELLEKSAWCASRTSNYPLAIKYFIKLTELEPQKAKWCYCVGYQYYMQKQWDAANEWFKKALTLYPNYLIVKYRYGYSLRQTCGNRYVLKNDAYWQALKQFEECEQIWLNSSEDERKKNANIYAKICFQKGKLLLERNQMEEAITSFKMALTLKNDFDECSYQLSKTYLSIGELDKAKTYLPKCNNYYTNELRIDILLAENDLSAAENALKKLMQTRRKDYLHRKLANIYFQKGDLLSAFSSIRDAKRLNPKNHITFFEKAKLLISKNLLFAAKTELLHAIELKKEMYGSNYVEAENLLSEIEQLIIETSHSKDDPKELQMFSTVVQDNKRLKGKIEKYNVEKGFGFISCSGQSYFFHVTSVRRSMHHMLKQGREVTFEEGKSEKGPIADKVVIN